MTLYEFNVLSFEEKLKTVWDVGVFLDNYITKTERSNLYAISIFFVELTYDTESNKIININSFKYGHLLDKYTT